MAHSTPGSLPALYAFAGNALVTGLKFAGFLISGSSAFFSEAVHSAADTANQGLLLIGIKKSKRVADANYEYGYGNERFLWALISACGIFFVGAGVTMYHGIHAILEGGHSEISPILFVILFASAAIEAYALNVALKELRHRHPDETFFESLKSGDPITVAVVYEDTVAVLGVGFALCGITLTYLTGNAIWDGIASVGIGFLLACVALLLIQKNREFLIGKSIPREERELIIEILEKEPAIEKVIDFKSSILDIGKYHIKCEVEFNGAALVDELGNSHELHKMFDEIDGNYEEFKKFLLYHTNRIPRMMGRTIDDIEKKVISAVPSVQHLDIEIN